MSITKIAVCLGAGDLCSLNYMRLAYLKNARECRVNGGNGHSTDESLLLGQQLPKSQEERACSLF